MTWWLWPVSVTDEGPRLERAHGDWVWPQAHGRLGASLQQIGADGRYELIGLLNRGGQAYLWAARDHGSNDALVVVKTVHPRIDDSVAGARLIREARLLELLAGEPTVMPVLDWGPGRLRGAGQEQYETEQPWLVLPYRPHISLDRALVLSGGRLSADAAWRLGRDLGTALQHLHRHNVVHRDLSLRNVLLTPTGCVLADLGMAWAASMVDQVVEQQFTTGITHHQNLGVTWGWLAPEAARPPQDGRRPDREPAADVFGWGLHLFCALTGRHPWAGYGLRPSEDELYAMYDVGTRPSLEGLSRSDAPESIQRLVVAALSEKAADRPSAADLVRELGEQSPSLTATALQLATLRRQVESARRRTATDETRPQPPDEPWPAPPHDIQNRGRRLPVIAAALVVALLAAGTLGVINAQRDRREADRALAAGQLFPIALQAALSLKREGTIPYSVKDRAGTDAAPRRLQADLPDLKFAAELPGTPDPQNRLEDIQSTLSSSRDLVDRLKSPVDPVQKIPVSMTESAAAQIAGSYVSKVNDAQAIALELTSVMTADATGPAAGASAGAARAGAGATFGATQVQADLLFWMRGGTVNIDRLTEMLDDSATFATRIADAQGLISDPEGHQALAAVVGQDATRMNWQSTFLDGVNNDSAQTGDATAYQKFSRTWIESLHSLALVSTGRYADQESAARRAATRWLAGWSALIVLLAAGSAAAVGAGFRWRRHAPRPATGVGPRPAAPTAERVPVGVSDV